MARSPKTVAAPVNTELSAALTRAERAETALATAETDRSVVDAALAEAQRMIAALNEKLALARECFVEQRNTIRELRAQCPVASAKPEAAQFDDYVVYCNAARAWCREAKRPVAYATRDQFNAAHEAQPN